MRQSNQAPLLSDMPVKGGGSAYTGIRHPFSRIHRFRRTCGVLALIVGHAHVVRVMSELTHGSYSYHA